MGEVHLRKSVACNFPRDDHDAVSLTINLGFLPCGVQLHVSLLRSTHIELSDSLISYTGVTWKILNVVVFFVTG